MIKRAFNQKTPSGATKYLRDILCYYATDGKNDWNEIITQDFSQYKNLLDEIKIISDISTKKNILQEILDKLKDVDAKISKPELAVIKKQVKRPQQNKPERISRLITIPSLNNPLKPEFPPSPFYNPKFPATNTYKINVPGFKNVWLKDESINPTGSHKDRMGWEITINALKFKLKEISIISSGTAAIAIQHMFNLFQVSTKLKVLVDVEINNEIKGAIRNIGCEVYETDLSKNELWDEQIRKLTVNKKGIDITYRETMDIHNIQYYDWMSYEILNINPDFCFIPFGTGDLFTNVLNIVNKEFNSRNFIHDPRLEGKIEKIIKCHFLGATTNNSKSKLEKLFSYFLPSLYKHKEFVEQLKTFSCVGKMSGIYFVKEEFVDEAIKIAVKEKINCEPSGIAGLALLLQMKEQIQQDKKILIVNTGRTNYYPEKPSIQR